MNVLSTFNGMGCIWMALDRLGIKVDKRYSSEVDKYANIVNDANYPDTIQLGDVAKVKAEDLEKIDLLVGGSPCQGFSFAGKQLNFEDPRSKLFFEFVRLLKECKPRYFLLENVKMKKEYEQIITDLLGVEPVEINSALVSAQSRKRLYWTNIEVKQPEDRGILLQDILACGRLVGRKIDGNGVRKDYSDIRPVQRFEARVDQKSGTITTVQKDNLALSKKALEYMDRESKDGRNKYIRHGSDIKNKKSATVVSSFFKGVPYNLLVENDLVRYFSPVEIERLQTVPDNYTNHVSNSQRYKMLGNGWNVETIVHILTPIK